MMPHMNRRPSLAGRAALAIALMIGFYALALGFCAFAVWLVRSDLESGRIHVKAWGFAVVTIGVVVYSLWPRRLKLDDPGIELEREQQPRLWAMIDTIAKASGQAPPRHVFLVGELNAFVAERNSRMGMGGERVLGIGLPLMQVLTVQQLRSVIAHEFGHYHGGDTRLGPFIYRTRDAIGRTITTFREMESLLHKPFEWYGMLYLRATFAISRAQEFAADALSVQLVGLDPARTALRRINEVGPLFEHYMQRDYLPMLRFNCRPPLAQGFRLFLNSQAVKRLQVQLEERAMQAKGNPYDTHPPLSERLQALEEVEDAATGRSDGPLSVALLDGLDALERDLLEFLTQHEAVQSMPTLSWSEASNKYPERWALDAAQTGPKLPATAVKDLISLVPKLEQLAGKVYPNIKGFDRRDAGISLLGMLFAHALVRAGFRIETSPGEPLELVRGSTRLDPFERVADVCEKRSNEADWRKLCDELAVGELVLCGPALAAQ